MGCLISGTTNVENFNFFKNMYVHSGRFFVWIIIARSHENHLFYLSTIITQTKNI